MTTPATIAIAPDGPGLWHRTTEILTRLISHDVIAVTARLSLAAVFLQSGRTKVDGVLHVTDSAVALFREEYKLPLLPPEIAAHLAAYAEHFLPLLLILGLGTRLAAVGLLGMTLVIEIFASCRPPSSPTASRSPSMSTTIPSSSPTSPARSPSSAKPSTFTA